MSHLDLLLFHVQLKINLVLILVVMDVALGHLEFEGSTSDAMS